MSPGSACRLSTAFGLSRRSPSWRFISATTHTLLYLGLDVGRAYVYHAFDTRFDSLAVGCLLAVWVEGERFQSFAKTLAYWSWVPLVTVALLAWTQGGRLVGDRYVAGFTVYSLLVAVLIVQLLQLHDTRLWRWLDHPVTRYLGVISYPVYLYHQWALDVARWFTFLPKYGQFAIGTFLTVAAASGSYFIVERPFLRLKQRLSRA